MMTIATALGRAVGDRGGMVTIVDMFPNSSNGIPRD
jgi:hypothetical protein